MGIPVATALARRDRLWPTILVSAVLHVVAVSWAAVRRPPAPIDLAQKPIVAKLVRLGEKRPEHFLPRKEAPPPDAAPPAPVPAVVAAPAAPAKPAAPAPAAPPAKPATPSTGKSGTTLASVLSRVQRDADEERWGSPDGDPMGDAETGSEGDRYLALVVRALQGSYGLPKTISQQDLLHLRATVVLLLDGSGRIVGHSFERRSGNDAFDAALERAIQAARLPPPPAALRDHYRTRGLGVNFHL